MKPSPSRTAQSLGRSLLLPTISSLCGGKLTDDNLASVSLSNDDSDEAFVTYTGLTCGDTVSVKMADGKFAVTFPIREKTELEILKAKLAQIESEQADQNNAIDSLTDAALA